MPTELFTAFASHHQLRVNRVLEHLLADSNDNSMNRLMQALRYSVLNGGKRIRPILCYAAAQAMGEINQDTDLVASSVECIHAYSLIHDDLPAMDNDNLRRGKPTCHIQFDEATAILAGDALQALAFQQLAKLQQVSAPIALEIIHCLAMASGAQGMVAGQAIDIASVNQKLTLDQLQHMHLLKTGAMISASITMGALSTGQTNSAKLSALAHYGNAIGLAFQIQDDILDVVGQTKQLGKAQGADKALNKPTYTTLLGLDSAKQKALQLHQKAIDSLAIFDQKADSLRAVADYIIHRDF